MKISSLRISNVLSFKYYPDIAHAEELIFDDGLNILIGENGSGKSTALEVINFIFKRVLFKQFNIRQDLYDTRTTILAPDRKQILTAANATTFNNFRLEPNWNSEDKSQVIRIKIRLDAIDDANINSLKENATKLGSLQHYTTHGETTYSGSQREYTLDITLNKATFEFSVSQVSGASDFGYEYLADYNYFKELITLYNLEHPDDQVSQLYESFTLISSYRNYHAFNTSISLRDAHPAQQMLQIRNQDFSKSLNANDQTEPGIFSLVRLRIAEKHFGLISKKLTEQECEVEANKLPFIVSINKRLKVINLKCRIRLIDLRTWQYAFEFYDTRRNKVLSNINSLSSGQKAIIHLVFEAYGRGDIKGGLVIIDEPEIHLHYQFQHEYLQVIRELNTEQHCQYILVTHSEALINSSTISQVKRFALSADGSSEFKAPQLTASQKVLIRILDNTRSTYAFFAKKRFSWLKVTRIDTFSRQ